MSHSDTPTLPSPNPAPPRTRFRLVWRYVRVEASRTQPSSTTRSPSPLDLLYLGGGLRRATATMAPPSPTSRSSRAVACRRPRAVVLADCRFDWNLPASAAPPRPLRLPRRLPPDPLATFHLGHEQATGSSSIEVTSPSRCGTTFGINATLLNGRGAAVVRDRRPGRQDRPVVVYGYRNPAAGYSVEPAIGSVMVRAVCSVIGP